MLRFASPILILAASISLIALRGAWTFAPAVAFPLVMCGLDEILGDAAPGAIDDGRGPALAAWLYIGLQIVTTLAFASLIALGRVTGLEAAGMAVTLGLLGGVFGMLAAHELVHKPQAADRAWGMTMLAVFGYMHFRIAHIHGHHVYGATPQDSASARRGEGAYAFFVRAVTGQLREAWAFETRRLARRGRPAFSLNNRMLVYGALEAVLFGVIAAISLRAFAFWLAQAALAILMLELFNYIAHYGLARARKAGGGYERIAPRHSWNSARRMTNRALFNMGRHADHHCRPQIKFTGLEAIAHEPQLPCGYAGAILMALVPPLWFHVMDWRVQAHSDGRPPIGGLSA